MHARIARVAQAISPAERLALALLAIGLVALVAVVGIGPDVLREVARRVVAAPSEGAGIAELSVSEATSVAVPGDVSGAATSGGGAPADGAADPAGALTAAGADVVIVDVAGQVHSPGLVELPAGARVADAIRQAGGALPGVEVGVNLARPLVDGEQIVIGVSASASGPVVSAEGGPPLTPHGLLDLNRASHEDLLELPGVGPVTADKILARRDEVGRFGDVVELLEVPGIGPARFAELEQLVGV